MEDNETSEYGYLTSAPWGPKGRSFVLGATALVAQVYLDVLNSTKIYNVSRFYKSLYCRDTRGQGLLTVSNHISTVDDPSLFCALLPLSFFLTEHDHGKNRWTMCAKEFCFKTKALGTYFQNGKVLPIERGKGMGQPTMGAMTERLSRGDWVHVFPEGKISKDQKLGPMKFGTAKILCEGSPGAADPVVLPFYHRGLEKVMPIGTKIPRVGHNTTVVVGRPIDFGNLILECKKNHQKTAQGGTKENSGSQKERKMYYKEIMAKIEQSLLDLERECENLHEASGA